MENKLKQAGEKVIYNYSAVVLAQFLSMPVAILYLSMVTRTLGVVRFGQLTLFLATAQFFFCVFINWTRNAIIRFGSEAFAKEKNLGVIIGSQCVITASFFVFAVMILCGFRNYLGDLLGLGRNSYLWLILYLAAYILSDFVLQFLKVRHRMRSFAVAIFLRQLILAATFVLIFFIFKSVPHVSSVISIEIISYVFILAIFFAIAFSYKSILSSISYNFAVVREILSYSWPVMILVILGYSMTWADMWMIKFFLTSQAVGEYAVSSRLLGLTQNLIMPLGLVGAPLVVSLRKMKLDSPIYTFATKIVPQLCFFWSLSIVVLLFASEQIVYLIFGKSFFASVVVFRILLIGASFQILAVLNTSILQAYDWTKRMAWIMGVSVIVNIFLNTILIPHWGIVGAAFSKTCSFVISGLLYYLSAMNCLRAPKDNHSIYYFFLMPILAIILVCFFHNTLVSFLVMAGIYALSGIFIKKAKIFSEEAWAFWEKIKMPNFVRHLFKKIYWIFI